jgi:hypothetical protein
MSLPKLPHYTSTVIWEAKEISLHKNFNRESEEWKNITHTVKQEKGCHNHTPPTNPRTERGTPTTTP